MLILLGDGACLTLLKTHMKNPKNSGASPPLSVGLSVDFIHHRHLLAEGRRAAGFIEGEKSGPNQVRNRSTDTSYIKLIKVIYVSMTTHAFFLQCLENHDLL